MLLILGEIYIIYELELAVYDGSHRNVVINVNRLPNDSILPERWTWLTLLKYLLSTLCDKYDASVARDSICRGTNELEFIHIYTILFFTLVYPQFSNFQVECQPLCILFSPESPLKLDITYFV